MVKKDFPAYLAKNDNSVIQNIENIVNEFNDFFDFFDLYHYYLNFKKKNNRKIIC